VGIEVRTMGHDFGKERRRELVFGSRRIYARTLRQSAETPYSEATPEIQLDVFGIVGSSLARLVRGGALNPRADGVAGGPHASAVLVRRAHRHRARCRAVFEDLIVGDAVVKVLGARC
jgi:hypothetical protein